MTSPPLPSPGRMAGSQHIADQVWPQWRARRTPDTLDPEQSALVLPEVPGWMQSALCAQVGPDDETFYPEKGGSPAAAKALCAECDARQACLDDALARNDQWGVWGGLTVRERRKLRAGRDCRRCGTSLAGRPGRVRYCGPCSDIRRVETGAAHDRKRRKGEAA